MDPRIVPLPPSPLVRSNKKTLKNKTQNHCDTIRLNVGGIPYQVSRDTMTRYKGSLLAALTSTRENDDDDELFLFRDGPLFAHVLDYVRSNGAKVHLPSCISRTTLEHELDYFQIPTDGRNLISEEKDYHTIERLKQEIQTHQAAIHDKQKELAAVAESNRLAYELTWLVTEQGFDWSHVLAPSITVTAGIDTKILKECLLSQGLDAYGYQIKVDSKSRVAVSLGPIQNSEDDALNQPFRFAILGCEPFASIPIKETPVAKDGQHRPVRVRIK